MSMPVCVRPAASMRLYVQGDPYFGSSIFVRTGLHVKCREVEGETWLWWWGGALAEIKSFSLQFTQASCEEHVAIAASTLQDALRMPPRPPCSRDKFSGFWRVLGRLPSSRTPILTSSLPSELGLTLPQGSQSPAWSPWRVGFSLRSNPRAKSQDGA